jgi:hypothetical protein
MRKVRFALSMSVALFSVNDALNACGEKFAVPGRCLPYGHAYAPIYSATILIDATPRAGGPVAFLDAKLQAAFKLVGHQVSRVDNQALVGDALRSGKIDVIIADLAEATTLSREAVGSSANPIVLPVMPAKPTKAVTEACRATFGDRCELKASDNPEKFLRAIDDVMRARDKARKSQKR